MKFYIFLIFLILDGCVSPVRGNAIIDISKILWKFRIVVFMLMLTENQMELAGCVGHWPEALGEYETCQEGTCVCPVAATRNPASKRDESGLWEDRELQVRAEAGFKSLPVVDTIAS